MRRRRSGAARRARSREASPCGCVSVFTPVGSRRGVLTAELAERGVKTDRRAVWTFVREEGLSFKKKACSPASRIGLTSRANGNAGRPARRALTRARLVFIDETSIKTNMTPLRGWGPKGRRLVAKAPHGRWKTMTFIAALRCDRLDAPLRDRRPHQWRELRRLCRSGSRPNPEGSDIVVLDNLGSHKGLPPSVS